MCVTFRLTPGTKGLSSIKVFRKAKASPGIISENYIEPELPSVFNSEMLISKNNSEDQPEKRNLKALTNIRLKNRNRYIIGRLNINSIRNKFDFLCSEISPSLYLLLVSETKLDDSFPTAQFLRTGFCKAYRLDRCSDGGGLLLYIGEDIPSRLLNEYKPPKNAECFFVEINIRKKKWLHCCSYNPHKNNISNHLYHLNKGLDVYLKHYDN